MGNLESPSNTCGLGPGDQVNVTVANLKLGSLADNGGPTLTHHPGPGSAAIDMGDDSDCTAEDQRGVPRPIGAKCDVGSVEVINVDLIFADGFESDDTSGRTTQTPPP